MQSRPRLIVCDIHGTLMPESLDYASSQDYLDEEYNPGVRQKLVDYVKKTGSKLVLLSGGTNVQITANLQYLGFYPQIPVKMMSNHGAVVSTDGGCTWVPYLLNKSAYQVRLEIERNYGRLKTRLTSEGIDYTSKLEYKDYAAVIVVTFSSSLRTETLIIQTLSQAGEVDVLNRIAAAATTLVLFSTVKGVSKAAAIKRLITDQNLASSDVLFYGNGGNDFSALVAFPSLLSQTHQLPGNMLTQVTAAPLFKGLAVAPYVRGLVTFLERGETLPSCETNTQD